MVNKAILLRDAQNNIKRQVICQLQQNQVLQNNELKLILASLDAERIPRGLAENILGELYTCPRFLPENLQRVCWGLYFVVRHIEAVC